MSSACLYRSNLFSSQSCCSTKTTPRGALVKALFYSLVCSGCGHCGHSPEVSLDLGNSLAEDPAYWPRVPSLLIPRPTEGNIRSHCALREVHVSNMSTCPQQPWHWQRWVHEDRDSWAQGVLKSHQLPYWKLWISIGCVQLQQNESAQRRKVLGINEYIGEDVSIFCWLEKRSHRKKLHSQRITLQYSSNITGQIYWHYCPI